MCNDACEGKPVVVVLEKDGRYLQPCCCCCCCCRLLWSTIRTMYVRSSDAQRHTHTVIVVIRFEVYSVVVVVVDGGTNVQCCCEEGSTAFC